MKGRSARKRRAPLRVAAAGSTASDAAPGPAGSTPGPGFEPRLEAGHKSDSDYTGTPSQKIEVTVHRYTFPTFRRHHRMCEVPGWKSSYQYDDTGMIN